MIDGRFDQHFLELFAKGEPQRRSAPGGTGLLVALVGATVALAWLILA